MYLHSLISPYYGLIVSGFNSKSLYFFDLEEFPRTASRSLNGARAHARKLHRRQGTFAVQEPPRDGYRQALSTPISPIIFLVQRNT